MATKQQRPSVSRFERLELPGLPVKNADEVREFIEGITSRSMLSLSGKTLPAMPNGAKVFVSDTMWGAFSNAHSAWTAGDLLRKLGLKKPRARDSVLNKGLRTIRQIAGIHGRFFAARKAMDRTCTITKDELDRKISGEGAILITRPIVLSAVFAAGIKTIEDINFDGRDLLVGHASERWKLIEDGFCIYAYDGTIPYIYYQKGDGSSGRLALPPDTAKFT
jgi:hypothetical protein